MNTLKYREIENIIRTADEMQTMALEMREDATATLCDELALVAALALDGKIEILDTAQFQKRILQVTVELIRISSDYK